MNELLFGHRPLDFADLATLFEGKKDEEIDITKLNFISIINKSIEAGFKHLEINGDLLYVFPHLFTPDKIGLLKDIKSKLGLSFSVHLPLWGIEPAAFSPHIRKAAVEAFTDAINLTKELDPICYVIHPTGSLTVEFLRMNISNKIKNLAVNQFTNYAKESLNLLIESIDFPTKKIAVENIEFPFELMYKVIEELDLGICFDTGHLLAGYSGEIEIMSFLDRYYDKIVEIHLHDGRFPGVDHKTLGSLDLPVKNFIDFLIKKKFKGPIVYELSLQESIDSMHIIRKLY
ncbi:MAG: cobamide remodeling phosphodiesterase CbiR [Candidatus Heimdallarchaeaceae archaeon]